MSGGRGFKFAWHKSLLNDAEVPPMAKLVALAVWDHAHDGDGSNAHPGERRLAQLTGLSERSVRAQLKILRDAGWLRRTAVRQPGTKRADTYRLAAPKHAVVNGPASFRSYFDVPEPDTGTCPF